MKKIIILFSVLLLIGITSSFKSDSNDSMRNKNEVIICQGPILTFDGMTSPTILCTNKTYAVSVSGTNNVVFSAITGGTLNGPTNADIPPNNRWSIRTGNTAGTGAMTITVWGQCWEGGVVVGTPTMTYHYDLLASGGPGGMCNK